MLPVTEGIYSLIHFKNHSLGTYHVPENILAVHREIIATRLSYCV